MQLISSRAVRQYFGEKGTSSDEKIQVYYRKLQQWHFTMGLLELYIILHMLGLHFFVEGQGFTYCSVDTGDLEVCDVGIVITGAN